VSLDADFGARTVAADIDYPARTFFEDDQFGRTYYVDVGVKASGTGSIGSNADFAIPLAGTSITPDPEGMEPDLVEPVTGSISGAFFGPNAAEAGGLTSIIKDSGETVWQAEPFVLGQ